MQNNLQQFEYLVKIMNYTISEDCLYLNIWSAHHELAEWVNNTDKISSENLLPVVIFIHGGGFNYMGISFESYYGGLVAAMGKVVFITVNYRLGVFGFFNNHLEQHDSKLYSNNFGLYDQIAAIKWVKENVHFFGGESNKNMIITLFIH